MQEIQHSQNNFKGKTKLKISTFPISNLFHNKATDNVNVVFHGGVEQGLLS